MKMIGKRYPFYAKYTVRAIDLLMMRNKMVFIVINNYRLVAVRKEY